MIIFVDSRDLIFNIGSLKHDRLETNLLSLFAHSENLEWLTIISVIFLRSTLLLKRNTHN